MCTSNRDDRKLENTVKQKLIQTLVRASQGVDWSWSQCIKSHHAQTSSRKRATKPLLKQKHRQKHLTWLWEKKELDCCSVVQSPFFRLKVNFAFHLEIKVWSRRKTGEAQNPSCLKSSVKFLKSVMILGAVTSAGVGPLCFIMSKVNAAVYPGDFRALLLPSADSFMEMLISFSSRTLAPAHSAKTTSKCFADHDILCLIGQPTCLTWTPYGIYAIFFKRNMRNSRSNNPDELKAQ